MCVCVKSGGWGKGHWRDRERDNRKRVCVTECNALLLVFSGGLGAGLLVWATSDVLDRKWSTMRLAAVIHNQIRKPFD